MNKRLRQSILKWLLLVALLVYVGLAAAWAIDKSRLRPCAGIVVNIDGTGPIAAGISKETIKHELGALATNYARTPIGKINVDSIERYLSRFNNFEHVECYLDGSARLCLNITPMVPVARIFTDNDSYYINRAGKRIDARPEYYADVPVVYGKFTRSIPASMSLPVVDRVASDSLLRSLVTMIVYRSPDNIMVVPRLRGHIVNLGDTSNLDTKFKNLLLAYRKILPVKGWDYYDTISVKFKGQVVCTRRDKRMADHGPGDMEFDDSEEAEIPLEDLAPASVEARKSSSRNN